uniref:40S ribosomal protein S21 n=1 Tax=Physcomitrium patens TaxID=3218 RepID=A0A2K1IFZ6_PHYPA|nr:hypothetical protein PHYPA_028794 [Physcomitrium patens]
MPRSVVSSSNFKVVCLGSGRLIWNGRRVCARSSSTNRLITSKDVASVQLNVGHVDENGVYTGQFTTFALCGFVRAQGDADSALDRLWAKKKAELGQ